MRVRTFPVLVAVLFLSGAAPAPPAVGSRFPDVESEDLNGRPVSTREWERSPSLIVVTTDRAGSELTRGWFEGAKAQSLPRLRLRSIISLRLPFFVSVGKARGEARKQVPPEDWDDTILDVRGQSAKALGLTTSKEPYVFVVAEDGRVLARAHSSPHAPQGRGIWEALQRWQEPPASAQRRAR